jgi:hypothetical protein
MFNGWNARLIMEYPINSTARIFYDSDGNEVTLYQLVKREPSWASNRIIHLEQCLYAVLKECCDFSDLSKESEIKAAIALGLIDSTKQTQTRR